MNLPWKVSSTVINKTSQLSNCYSHVTVLAECLSISLNFKTPAKLLELHVMTGEKLGLISGHDHKMGNVTKFSRVVTALTCCTVTRDQWF